MPEIIVRPPLEGRPGFGYQPDADEVIASGKAFHLEALSDRNVWIGLEDPDGRDRYDGRTVVVIAAEWIWWRPWRPRLRVIVREE